MKRLLVILSCAIYVNFATASQVDESTLEKKERRLKIMLNVNKHTAIEDWIDGKLGTTRALVLATRDNQTERAKRILQRDPSCIEKRDYYGYSSLEGAAEKGRDQILDLMLSAKKTMNDDVQEKLGGLVMLSVRYGKLKNLQILVEKYKAPVDESFYYRGGSWTPLLLACENRPKPEVVEYLLNKGANANHATLDARITAYSKVNPLSLVLNGDCDGSNKETAEILRKYGAKELVKEQETKQEKETK